MQQFCSVSLQQNSPFTKFAPLLEQIRSRHINSIHQLPQNLLNFQWKDELLHANEVFGRRKQQSQQQNYISTFQNSSKFQKGSFMMTHKVSPSKNVPTPMDALNDYRVILINPASKIKAHLIKAIDFQQVEKALYAKPKQKDRFTALCQQIQKKSKQYPVQQSKKYQFNSSTNTIKVLDLGQKFNIISDKNNKHKKVYIRKKFWSRGKTQQCSRQNPEWLSIKTNKSPFKNCNPHNTAK